MKTTKRKARIYTAMTVLVLLFMVPAMAGAVDYKTHYRGMQNTDYRPATTVSAAPSTTFQSTSAYSVQWDSDAQQSMLNADGSVNTDSYLSSPVSKPRRNSTGNPGTPDDETEEDGEQQPLGDGLMTLMLCACAYLIVRATCKEEKIG